MPFTIQLVPHLEKRLLQKAEKEGVALDQLLNQILGEIFPPTPPIENSEKEADLLQQINKGFSEKFWSKYFDLINKRDAYKISQKELGELSTYSNKIEMASATRLKYLLELASLRNMDLGDLIEQLGIHPIHNAKN